MVEPGRRTAPTAKTGRAIIMDPEPETPKPKRHYTLTPKAREARRLSLAKAREKARRALRGYERGPQEDEVAYRARLHRQIAPWSANLRSASAARKADCSAHYATHFYHGLTAPDLDRSAAASGENRDHLRRHLERCQQTIGGLAGLEEVESQESKVEEGVENQRPKVEKDDGRKDTSSTLDPRPSTPSPTFDSRLSTSPDSGESTGRAPRRSKLVLALGYVLWRALRLMHIQVRWERRALAYRLQELAGWRAAHPALTAARLNRLQSDLDFVTRDVVVQSTRLHTLRKRFEALWTALFDPARW
ncbi:MAG TPA: hypothetical protein VGZ29_12375, partial [Terriglobia bacterium]|nr:hypothetical protein [Terriglobia bacterium]